MKFAAVLFSSMLFTFSQAFADEGFVRFWRGVPLERFSTDEFKDGLNRIFVPDTWRLAETSAKLRSYQPVLLPQSFISTPHLPLEVALVHYASESDYRAYRATPAGEAYSNLHWDYFAKEQSKSVVAEKFEGKIEFEHAYQLAGLPTNAQNVVPTFRASLRAAGQSDEAYLQSVGSHVLSVKNQQPTSYFILASQDYVLEYIGWSSLEDRERAPRPDASWADVVMDSSLNKSGELEYESGLFFAKQQ